MKRPLWTRLSAAALALLLTAALPAEAWAADQESAAAPAEEAPFVETTPVPPQSSPEAPAPAPQPAPSAPQETQPGTSDVVINETNFPDDNFRAIVQGLQGGDDGSFTPDEIAVIKKIECKNQSIKSLKGIEHFTNLTVLVCSGNPLTSLDVSKNKKLEWLRCSETGLTSLDLTANTELVGLECNKNPLTGLDISQNIKLDVLECQASQLRSLDVSNNTALTDLKVMNNQLTTLDTSQNTELLTLNCFGNSDLQIDVSKNTKLKYLNCSRTFLDNLDVTNNTALEYLSCYGGALTSLDVSKNPKLGILLCNSNWLTTLDVSQNTALTNLECQNNQLTELDVSQNTALSTLRCQENKLAFLNLGNTQVTDPRNLSCHGNGRSITCGTSLNELNGFDPSKASQIQGGSFDGGKVNYTEDTLTYTYDLGNGESESFSMTRSAHNVTLVTGKKPTCAAEGWRDYYQCSGCGKSFEDQDGTKEITDLEAWKTGKGKLDKIPHTTGEWMHNDTQHWKVCSVCNATTEQAPHTYGDWETVTPPTETTEGLQRHTCTVCGYVEESKLPVIPPSSGGGSSGGGSSSGNSVVTKPDGTTITTKPDGTTITQKPDGTTITTKKDPVTGTVTEVTKRPDGSTTTVETHKDGTTTTTNKTPTGTTGTVTTDKNGNVTQAEGHVSNKDVEQSQKDDQPVKLPVTVPVTPEGENAPSIEIEVPKGSGSVDVEIPVEKPTAGTVAVVVKPDGAEVPVKQFIVTENSVILPLDGSAVIKIVDRSQHFVDVHGADHWAKEYVDFVTARDLFQGTSDNHFSPDISMTRGMLVAVLYRLEDSPSLPEENLGYPLSDVASDDWYSDAVYWAAYHGIVSGYHDGRFGPNDTITREQMAVILYRYAQHKGYDTADRAALDKFSDSEQVSAWSADALSWANAEGLVNGTSATTLTPKGHAARAQVAAILTRFCQRVVE